MPPWSSRARRWHRGYPALHRAITVAISIILLRRQLRFRQQHCSWRLDFAGVHPHTHRQDSNPPALIAHGATTNLPPVQPANTATTRAAIQCQHTYTTRLANQDNSGARNHAANEPDRGPGQRDSVGGEEKKKGQGRRRRKGGRGGDFLEFLLFLFMPRN